MVMVVVVVVVVSYKSTPSVDAAVAAHQRRNAAMRHIV